MPPVRSLDRRGERNPRETNMPGLFEIDSEGWKAQQKGRDPWELIREVIQNALDEEAHIYVRINSRQRKVTVEDRGSGFENLSDAYTIFGGDKGADPKKRGRWGRGLKETVGGAERVVVMTPDGTVEFQVRENERIEHDRTYDKGTKVVVENSEWSKEQMDEIKEYVFKLWAPEGQDITVDLKGGRKVKRDRWEPDFVTSEYLTTVIVEDGVMKHDKRRTEVHVRRADGGEGDGRVYEMGIPVTMNEPFPYWVDVQQKIPMAEQRNEPDRSWLKSFRPRLLNTVAGDMTADELKADWVGEALSSHRIDPSTNQTYVNKVLNPDGKKAVVSSTDQADDICRNYGYTVLDTSRMSSGPARAASRVLPDSAVKAQELHEKNERKVEPTEEQRQFKRYAASVARFLGHDNVAIETWEIDPSFEGEMVKADANTTEERIRLNVKANRWEEVNESTFGTLVHELAHLGAGTGAHGEEWYSTMQDYFAKLAMADRDFSEP